MRACYANIVEHVRIEDPTFRSEVSACDHGCSISITPVVLVKIMVRLREHHIVDKAF